MTKNEKQVYKSMKTIAYFSGFDGIEIKTIEYGIEDYIIYTSGAWIGKSEVHKSKIYYTGTENDYFRYGNNHIRLNECIRCNIGA